MPVVSCNELALGTVTTALVPLNTSALPYLPAVIHVAALIVPLLPLPDRSVSVVPDPSLKPYAATRPLGAALDTVTETTAEVVWLPAASRARAVRLWLP